MENPWPHRLAILIAACALFVLVSGALLTDYHQASSSPANVMDFHSLTAMLMGVLTLGLAIWLSIGTERWVSVTAWVSLVLLAGAGFLERGSAQGLKSSGIFHALLAQLFFAAMVVIIVATSKGWKAGPDLVFDQGWPSLRFLGNAMFVLVLAQVSLGAAFRHKASGLMPHLVGAMIVALWILIVCMFVMQQFPEHRSLRPAANFLLAVTLAQVFLGIGALTMRMLNDSNTTGLLISTAGHVTTGALTLASATILTFQIRRNVQPKPAEAEDAEEAEEASSSN